MADIEMWTTPRPVCYFLRWEIDFFKKQAPPWGAEAGFFFRAAGLDPDFCGIPTPAKPCQLIWATVYLGFSVARIAVFIWLFGRVNAVKTSVSGAPAPAPLAAAYVTPRPLYNGETLLFPLCQHSSMCTLENDWIHQSSLLYDFKSITAINAFSVGQFPLLPIAAQGGWVYF